MLRFKTIPLLNAPLIFLCICLFPAIVLSRQVQSRNNHANSIHNYFDTIPASRLNLNLPGLPAFKNRFSQKGHSLLDTLGSGLFMNRVKIISEQADAFKQVFGSIENDLKKNLEAPVSLKHASLSVVGQAGNFNSDSFRTNNYNLFDANLAGTAVGIPFAALYQNHYYPFIDVGNQNRLSFRYDRDAYLDGLKKKLAGKFNPESFLENIRDPVEMLKATAEKALSDELKSLNDQYRGHLSEKIRQLGNPSDLFLQNPATIRQQLLNNEWLNQLQVKSEMLAQIQNRINTGAPVNLQELNNLKSELEKYKGVGELLKIIEAHNKKWQESGLIKKIKESGLIKKDMLQKIINDPAVIRKMAKQKLDLNGVQRLFLSITKLNIGQSTADFSRLLTGNTLLSGLNTGFLLNEKKSFDLLAGKQRTFNSMLDMPFANNIFNTDNGLIGLRLNNGQQSGNGSSISLLAFQTAQNGQLPYTNYSLPRKSMVIGMSKQVEISKTNHVEVEISKSSGSFLNEISSDSGNSTHRYNCLFNSENILKSLAASVNYSGEFEKINLQTETYIRYAGIHYDNPAGSFVPGGTREIGAGIRKTFLQKRLQVYGRTNWRQYKFSETTNNQWRSSNHFIDVKWKMRKGQSVSLRYQPARSIRITNSEKITNAVTERLAANVTLTARVKSFQYRNYFTLSYLRNEYAYTYGQLASNKSFQIISLQSFAVGKQVFYSNTTFTNVNNPSAFIFFNTSFNSDLGITYNIGKNLSASSSVNYNSVKGWYQQVACKQSLSGQLGEKIRMDIYIDIGKNIKQLQPLPFRPYRAEWSIQYLFNR